VESKPEPLNGRGWTLQESILSRLNVLFAKDRLHWERQLKRHDEFEAISHTDLSHSTMEWMKLSKIISSLEHNTPFSMWYEIVED
jgi:hypothetical protein